MLVLPLVRERGKEVGREEERGKRKEEGKKERGRETRNYFIAKITLTDKMATNKLVLVSVFAHFHVKSPNAPVHECSQTDSQQYSNDSLDVNGRVCACE